MLTLANDREPRVGETVKKQRDDLAGSGGDLVTLAVKFDLRCGMNLARGTQREAEIEQR